MIRPGDAGPRMRQVFDVRSDHDDDLAHGRPHLGGGIRERFALAGLQEGERRMRSLNRRASMKNFCGQLGIAQEKYGPFHG